MSERNPRSIFLDGRSWPLFHGLASLFLLGVLILHWSPFDDFFDMRITSPMLFQLREKFGKTPAMDPRIKVIALDDSTFSYLGGPRLTYPQLSLLLKHLAAKKPKVILVDSLLADIPQEAGKDLGLNTDGVPVYTGNFVSNFKVRYRKDTVFDTPNYQASTYLQGIYSLDQLPYNLDNRTGWFVYGHSEVYDPLITSTGHITYNRDGTISPFYRIADDKLVPHLSMYAAEKIRLLDKGLIINGHKVPLNDSGGVMVNHRPPVDFYDRAATLRPFLQRAEQGVPEPRIEEGDVILILLAFATGNTDFHENGPFGDVPGGLMIASMISDILQGTWLSNWEIAGTLTMIFGLLGIIVGINLRIRAYLGVLVGVWAVYTSFVIASFVYFSVWCPWALPLLAFTGTSIIHFVHVRIHEEMKLMLIERNYQKERARRLESQRERQRVRGPEQRQKQRRRSI